MTGPRREIAREIARGPVGPYGQRVAQPGRVGSRDLDDRTARARAAGIDVLSVWGSPVCALEPHVERAVVDACREPLVLGSLGLMSLREAIAVDLKDTSGAEVSAERNLLVTTGAMQALDVVFRSLLGPGENVVVPAPNFFFAGFVELAGGQARYVPQEPSGDTWTWDVARLEQAIDEHTRGIVFSNPVNPTGFLARRPDLEAIDVLAREHGLWVVCDEAFARYVFDGAPFVSALELDGWARRWIVVRSLGKSHALGPWRVGYLAAERDVIERCTRVLEWETLYTAHVGQAAALAALTGPQTGFEQEMQRLRECRDVVWQGIAQSQWLSASCPRATPFLFVDVGQLTTEGIDAGAALLDVGIPTVRGLLRRSRSRTSVGWRNPRYRTCNGGAPGGLRAWSPGVEAGGARMSETAGALVDMRGDRGDSNEDLRIGVDIGGTFTDIVAFTRKVVSSGARCLRRRLTMPTASSRASARCSPNSPRIRRR